MARIVLDEAGVPSAVQLDSRECAGVLAEMERSGDQGNATRRQVMSKLERVARYAMSDLGHQRTPPTRDLAADMSGGPDIADHIEMLGVMEAAEVMHTSERQARRVLTDISRKDGRGRWVVARCDLERKLAGHG